MPPSALPSSSANSSDDFNLAVSSDKRDVAAKSLQYQRLEKALDMTHYIRQVEQLLSQPIKIPPSAVYHHPTHPGFPPRKQGFFSIRGIWPTEEKRKEKVSKFFSVNNTKGREWVRDLLLDESDSDEEAEPTYTQRDLRAMLKIHKNKRDLQKKAAAEGVSQQYSFYSAGMLSAQDSYSESSRNRSSKSVEVSSQPPPTPSPVVFQPLADDAPEPLSVDANFPNSTVIPLPPLSH